MSEPHPPSPAAPAPRVKLLLVDDLEENLLALGALLARDDVELLEAPNASEALELLLVNDVALALLDVQMPEVDGFELAELMRGAERTRHVPIIFITAGGRDQHRQFKGYDTGAVDFLYKPIEAHILRHKVNVFIELYRQRQQLADQLRELTETLRLNEMFTAVLGHDLRNPLNAILTSAQLMERRAADEAVRKSATRITSAGRRMSRMIEDVLDLARARLAGGIQLKRQPTDLAVLLQDVVEEYQAAMPMRHIELQRDGDVSGEWDADRLAQVASNLIGNALQHGAEQEPVQVRVDGSRADRVRLQVTNVGEIGADVAGTLFDPFRGRARGGRTQGLGLGLYIVQQIVHAHHGEVVADTAVNGRTTFSVELPRRASEVVRL